MLDASACPSAQRPMSIGVINQRRLWYRMILDRFASYYFALFLKAVIRSQRDARDCTSSSNREDLGRTLGWEAIPCGGGDGSCRDLVPLHACLNSPPRFPIFKWYSPRVSWACANKRTTIPDCLVGTSAEFLPSDLVLQQLVSDPFLRKVRDANSLGGGLLVLHSGCFVFTAVSDVVSVILCWSRRL